MIGTLALSAAKLRPQNAERRIANFGRQVLAPGASVSVAGSIEGFVSKPTRVRMTSTSASDAAVEDEVVFSSGRSLEKVLLNRPAKFNALNLSMVRALLPRYAQWAAEGSTRRCVLMRGAGGKAFCAGGDVASLRESGLTGGNLGEDFFFEEYQLNNAIATAPNLVQVSVWDGVTMGGGVGLSLHGAVRVATEKTRFAMPETALGLFPDVGGTFALSRLKAGYAVGVYIALSGVHLGSYDCLWAGLATHYLPRDELDTFADKLEASAITELEDVDELLRQSSAGVKVPGKDKAVLEPFAESIQECFNKESVEEILLALEQRNDEWSKATLAKLLAASPMSLKVTLRAIQLNAGANVTISHALQNEYRAAVRMLDVKSDFFEGVRAILVDKDNKPQWGHASVAQVTEQEVENFFAPLGNEFKRGELVF